ncbi:MAG TPA: hypothetical protein VLK84_14265 [Longimicrobium sp.]|nr:hypothetical protein [Longimicrobium sp.]
MRKLSLDLDARSVDGFDTDEARVHTGTCSGFRTCDCPSHRTACRGIR